MTTCVPNRKCLWIGPSFPFLMVAWGAWDDKVAAAAGFWQVALIMLDHHPNVQQHYTKLTAPQFRISKCSKYVTSTRKASSHFLSGICIMGIIALTYYAQLLEGLQHSNVSEKIWEYESSLSGVRKLQPAGIIRLCQPTAPNLFCEAVLDKPCAPALCLM